VHKKLPTSKYIAIKKLVFSYLMMSLSVYTEKNKNNIIKQINIPLHKGRDNSRVLYISGIALRLSKYEKIPAMDIAGAIASHLSVTCGEDFKVQIVSPGWIHLELAHPTLAAWLQSIVEGAWGMGHGAWGIDIIPNSQSPVLNSQSPMPDAQCPMPNSLFTAQYAHARCCSLLRLAYQEGLVKLRQPDVDTASVGVLSFKSIPWLDCDAKLRLNHPASSHLIAELVKVVDELEYTSSVISIPDRDSCRSSRGDNWEKAALDLSQAFETFWSNCRILGEVKTTSPELAQARLGLVMATQSVLRFLLEEKLGVSALVEL